MQERYPYARRWGIPMVLFYPYLPQIFPAYSEKARRFYNEIVGVACSNDGRAFREDLAARPADPSRGMSLYVHVPFCYTMCSYCYINKYPYATHHHLLDAFVDGLKREIALYGQAPVTRRARIDSIHFGGGTPTVLSAQQLCDVLATCREALTLSPEVEVTCESKFNHYSLEDFERMRAAGFNRISMGIQTFQPRILRMIGLPENASERGVEDIERLRRMGFRDVSIDLMYGFPSETLEEWAADVQTGIDLGVTHMSVYNLHLEPNVPLARRIRDGELTLIPQGEAIRMFEHAMDALHAAGYVHFAGPDFAKADVGCKQLRNTFGDGDNLAIGPGATGYVDGLSYANIYPIEQYISSTRSGTLPVDMYLRATEKTRMERTIISSVDLFEIDKARFHAKHGVRFEETYRAVLDDLLAKGVIEEDPDRVRLTRTGRIFHNNIGIEFFPSDTMKKLFKTRAALQDIYNQA